MSDNIITLDLTSDATASALVATIRAEVNGDRKYAAYVSVHGVTSDNVADHARALAVATYPNEEQVQRKDGKRTKFGNAVQKAGAGLRRALTPEETDETEVKDVKYLTAAGCKVESLSDVLGKVEAEWRAAHQS
jgi:homoserine acetyltransferase